MQGEDPVMETVEEEFRALSMIFKSGLDLDLVERAYARKLIYATINLNEVFECEALKGLGDLYLHKAMMNTDKVENFHKACSLYMELLRYYRYTSVEKKHQKVVEHRIKYAEKCTKLVHDQDIVKVRTTNSDNTILGVSMMLDKVEKKTRVKGRDMMPLIECYTNSLVQAIVDSNKCLQVESLKSLGDLYLEKASVVSDKADWLVCTRAAGLYQAALDRCKDSDGRETLEHRINYAERVKRKLIKELDRPPWMLDRSAPIVSSPALNESLHGQTEESNAVLLMTDLYASSTVNREVVQILTRAGRKVYSMVLAYTEEDIKCAEADGVELILPTRWQGDTRKPCLDWLTFYHFNRYPNLPLDVGWIVGHTEVTSRAAAYMKEQRFPQASLSLVTQAIPEDTGKYGEEERAMRIGEKEDSIRQDAEKADTVFSVGHRTHEYFENSFRAIPEDKRPTHYLFLPKPSDLFQKTTVEYFDTNEKVVLLIGKVNTAERVKGFDLAAKTLSKVAERSQDRIKLRIRGVSREYQASMDILQTSMITTLLPEGTQEDICRDMQQAHLVLMPSCAEPFGLVGLEAMAAGVPVLISDRSGLATLVHEVIPEFHHSILRITGDDSVDVWRWADQIADVLRMSEVEFRRAAELKQKLLESRYWEESYQQFLQACGGHVSPRFEGVPKLRERSGEQQQEDGRLLEPSTLQLAVSQESNAVLLVTDLYASPTINREVVQILTRAGRKVYSMVLEATEEDRKCAVADGVELILPTRSQGDTREPCLDWLTYDHCVRHPSLPEDVRCIVGHTGVTSRAAATIKEQRFPQASLSLVTQTIPEDTEKYKDDRNAMSIGWKEDSIREDAEKADTVFSVGHIIHDHFVNSFRAIPNDKRPTHYLFLPKPSDLFQDTRVYYMEAEDKIVLLIGKVNIWEWWKGFDLVAKTLSTVAERSPYRIKLRICGVSEEEYEAIMSILQTSINSGKLIPTLLPHGTQEDVCRDMQQAHLVLMPFRAEPGLVGLEAMAAGVPKNHG
ncbi:uncharacterized protein LOC144907100 [Branchiostoma floridae x Branchiostoma belcheri]